MRSLRRILIVQPYGIGDALFVTPLLRALRTLPSVETVDLLLGSRTGAVFRNNPHVDRIFAIDKGRWQASRPQMLKEARWLWKELGGRYDLMIDFSLQREYGFYGKFFLQIPLRVGLNFKNRALFLNRSLSLSNGRAVQHAADSYSEVGRLIGLEVEDRFLEFYLSDQDRAEARQALQKKSIADTDRLIVLAPGGGESWGKDAHFKRWPAANFAQLVRLLQERIEFDTVLILGSAGEKSLGEEILAADGSSRPYKVLNLCGEVSLGGTAALLERARLFLANDGGLVHLAHALHVPLIAFYGPVDPRVYGPYPQSPEAVPMARKNLPCRPCYSGFRYNAACVDRECLTALAAKEVLEELDKRNFWERKTGKQGTGL